ncbi:MAG: hypothetical protein ACRYGK_01555 [Janthinobacterium lividum]
MTLSILRSAVALVGSSYGASAVQIADLAVTANTGVAQEQVHHDTVIERASAVAENASVVSHGSSDRTAITAAAAQGDVHIDAIGMGVSFARGPTELTGVGATALNAQALSFGIVTIPAHMPSSTVVQRVEIRLVSKIDALMKTLFERHESRRDVSGSPGTEVTHPGPRRHWPIKLPAKKH